MNGTCILSRAPFFIMTLFLAACAEAPVQRQQVFREADFRGHGGSGSGSVVGRAFVTMRDHSERIVANDSVELTPVTAYSTEAVDILFARNREITTGDSRFKKYIRTAPTDADGHFAFHHLPSSEYYVTGAAYFTHWFWNNDNTEKVVMHDCLPIYARVSVKDGQTTRVTDWSYGRQTSR